MDPGQVLQTLIWDPEIAAGSSNDREADEKSNIKGIRANPNRLRFTVLTL